MAQPNDGTNRTFIVQRGGQIKVAINGLVQTTPFLDVSSLITAANAEQGLLGMAFHPNYSTNGFFYVYYTATNGDNTLARFHGSASNLNQADLTSRTVLFALADRFSNHNGGNVLFGPDGFLYVGIGDGFDRATGDLMIGDIGQNTFEEVDRQLRDAPGGANYQWSCMEGFHPFNTSRTCTQGTSTPPIFEYDYSRGDCSITGGYMGGDVHERYGHQFEWLEYEL